MGKLIINVFVSIYSQLQPFYSGYNKNVVHNSFYKFNINIFRYANLQTMAHLFKTSHSICWLLGINLLRAMFNDNSKLRDCFLQ